MLHLTHFLKFDTPRTHNRHQHHHHSHQHHHRCTHPHTPYQHTRAATIKHHVRYTKPKPAHSNSPDNPIYSTHGSQPPFDRLRLLPTTLQYPNPKATAYIISYSTELLPTPTDHASLLHDLFTSPVPHLYTIFASNYHKPPHEWRHKYSGVHPKIQRHTMRDPSAEEAVQNAVRDVLCCLGVGVRDSGVQKGLNLRNETELVQVGRNGVLREVALSVCCGAGTHRSVAVAEVIKQRLNETVGHAVVLKVCHVHLVKMPEDPPD